MAQQPLGRRGRKLEPGADALLNAPQKHPHVAAPLAQQGHFQGQHAQPVEQIPPEAPAVHLGAQIHVGGRDDALVHQNLAPRAQLHDLLFLQHPQQLHLQHGAHGLDLVQKQSAAAGGLEEADVAALFCPGEGALLVAEQLAFQQRVRNGGAVDGHKGLLGPGAGRVDGMGEQLLAGAAFAADQDGGIAGGHPAGQLAGGHHAGAVTDDAVEGVFGHMALAQQLAANLLLAALLVPEALEHAEGGGAAAASVEGVDAHRHRVSVDLHQPAVDGLLGRKAFGKGQKGQRLLHPPLQQLLGGQAQNVLGLGAAGEDHALAVHADEPGVQRLLEQLEQAFHLHRTLEHLLNAVGLLGQ